MKFGAQATGIITLSNDTILDVQFPTPKLIERGTVASTTTRTINVDALPEDSTYLVDLAVADADHGTARRLVTATIASLDDVSIDTIDAYLHLHLLSRRLATPNSIDLDSTFSELSSMMWTSSGPCVIESFEVTRVESSHRGPITVYSIDKFPRMVDHVTSARVRIGDADRVHLGVRLAGNVTVMHEDFINSDTGTFGHFIVEGRISQRVVVDDGSNIGDGVSVTGTLSSGGEEVVLTGERCLLGASTGLGILLGGDCVLEAGLYIAAGTKCHVALDGVKKAPKAREFSDRSNILFRRNPLSGIIEAMPWAVGKVKLGMELYAN